jgi:hypothetical protein
MFTPNSGLRAPVVCGRVDAEGQAVRGGGIAKLVTDHARLNATGPAGRVQGDHVVHVLGEVEHHRRVDRLPHQARAAAAAEHRSPEAATELKRCLRVITVAREHGTDRDLPEDRRIERVKRPRLRVETNLTRNRAPQRPAQLGRIVRQWRVAI